MGSVGDEIRVRRPGRVLDALEDHRAIVDATLSAMRRLAVAFLVLVLAACGAAHDPSLTEQRATAGAFARAVLAGDAHTARSLVAEHVDRAVDEQAKRLSVGFAQHPAHLN